MTGARYPIPIGRRSALLVRVLFGARPDRAWVRLAEGTFEARFGRFRFETPVANIRRWRIEGPWPWVTAIGVRRGLRGGDVSFAGSPRGGIRLDLVEPVRWTIFRVPAFYACPDDLDGFAAELAALGIPGEDARRT